uniref:Uncharacterized protein n=1 Tax=Anguilla anguilla TaxID=7936 RepID=A0A0E9STX9_ANGAN
MLHLAPALLLIIIIIIIIIITTTTTTTIITFIQGFTHQKPLTFCSSSPEMTMQCYSVQTVQAKGI